MIMEDKTCTKIKIKSPSTLGMNQTRTQFLSEESSLSIFSVVTQERLVSPHRCLHSGTVGFLA